MLQKATDLLISRVSFQRVIKNIMQKINAENSMSDLHIQRSAINAMQETTKRFMIEIFESRSMFEIVQSTKRISFSVISDESFDNTC
jgi:histone H3/H4